ncbi:MAG: GNAT family N-acetyltransferase [Ignavibacteria bacterium]|nr:GNAT family N-acetyltransferase [Ignavibacteria bacterium]
MKVKNLRVDKLTEKNIPAFKAYFKKYSHEQDESNPPLDDFTINEDDPVYLLIEDGKISGAAALMLHPEYRESRLARFRIFHTIYGDYISYNKLLNSILLHTSGLTSIYAFIEDNYSNIANIWVDLGFEARRFAWILRRPVGNNTKPEFPPGFEMRTFREGIDEEHWCRITNDAFEHSLGHVRMTPEKLTHWKIDPTYIEDGMKMLWHDDKPVATLALIREEQNGEEVLYIDAIGVLTEYQGRGLGRNLLKFGIQYAAENNFSKVMLSVNGENEKAAAIYFKEGFENEALYKCYYLDVNTK